MSDWSAKQFAMELMVRGGYGVKTAIETVRFFDREWAHEEEFRRAQSDVLLAIFKGRHPDFAPLGEGPIPTEKKREIFAAARAAGLKALADSRSSEPS